MTLEIPRHRGKYRQKRQIIDQKPEKSAINLTQIPSPVPSSHQFEPDIPAGTLAFEHQDIQTLLSQGSVTLEMTGFAPLQLTLSSQRIEHGSTVITAISEDLVSTITLRGEVFYATLATPDQVLRLRGQKSAPTQSTRHAVLAQRWLPQVQDYAHIR